MAVFMRPRRVYESYGDLWRLAELAGFKTVFVDQMDQGADIVYITSPFTGEQAGLLGESSVRRARVVWWNLERPDSGQWPPEGANASNMVDRVWTRVDAIWVSDRGHAAADSRFIHAVFGSDAALAADGSPSPNDYDYVHLSYATPRRERVYTALRGRGFREAPNGWGADRDRVLRSSRIMINVHQTPAPIGEPQRIALAAAHRLPLVSEVIADPWPLVAGVHYIESTHGEIVDRASGCLLYSGGPLGEMADRLHRLLCEEWTFRRGVEDALRRTFAEDAQ